MFLLTRPAEPHYKRFCRKIRMYVVNPALFEHTDPFLSAFFDSINVSILGAAVSAVLGYGALYGGAVCFSIAMVGGIAYQSTAWAIGWVIS